MVPLLLKAGGIVCMEIRPLPLSWPRKSCWSLPTFDLVHRWKIARNWTLLVIILHTTNEHAMYKHWLQLDTLPDDCGVSDLHCGRLYLSAITA